MAQSTLDTHAAVQAMEAVGIVREQAEAIVETVRRADSGLATKADIAELRAEMKTGDAKTRAEIAELRTEIARVQYRILLAMAGLMVGLMGLLFAALRLTG